MRVWTLLLGALLLVGGVAGMRAQATTVRGVVVDPRGDLLPGARVEVFREGSVVVAAGTGADGRFALQLGQPGRYVVRVSAAGFLPVVMAETLGREGDGELALRMGRLLGEVTDLTVTADVTVADELSPDPAVKVFVRQDLLDANPGRPGAPVSLPGYPIETASSGIKAPQYFAPGVAGDHGEPIAQYLAVGTYLLTNNLSANAHGNGYADPNLLIPQLIESVQVDGGAFNVLEGNHAVNLAAIYGLRSTVTPFATLTVDPRDVDVVGGWSPGAQTFVGLEASLGNGFLKRLEHRQQFKLTTQRVLARGGHAVTVLGIGYFGRSTIPGLVPIFRANADDVSFPDYGDSIDLRQKDQTHTALVALNDTWTLTGAQRLLLSGFFRTYNLTLNSDFGDGLIRQSEFRTVTGATGDYVRQVSPAVSLLGGVDYLRDAPRRDNLDRYGLPDAAAPYRFGVFTPVSSNDVTITSAAPYAAATGKIAGGLRVYAGWRRDEIQVSNEDRLRPAGSSEELVGVNSPKATVSYAPGARSVLPAMSVSYGQAFFTEDPRTGSGTASGTAVATAHSYQLVASKAVAGTEVKLTLGHVTTSAELAKVDPDTGLQENQGPARNEFLTVAVRRRFRGGSVLATFSKADARDRETGQPTPEAPRTLVDVLLDVERLPLRLEARGEFEYVGLKPLGTGCLPDVGAQCTGTPVREVRGAVARPFFEGRVMVGVNFLLARGYSGQTLESFAPSTVEEVVGVRVPSYASATVTYRFGRGLAK